MPTSADSYGIAQALVTLALTAQVGGQPAYANGIAGEYKDLTDMTPCVEVYGNEDHTERAAITTMGAPSTIEIFDEQLYWIISTVSMTQAQTAWQSLWNIRDALTQLLHSSLDLGIAGVTFSAIEPKGEYKPVYRNGEWWLMHQIPMLVRYEYTATETA